MKPVDPRPAQLHDGYTPPTHPRPTRPREGARDLKSQPVRNRGADSTAIRPRLLGVRAAADLLSISPWTVRALVWNGELPEVRVGRRLLLDVRDLESFIERNKRREAL
jgi:excisionase family DNA binding protein